MPNIFGAAKKPFQNLRFGASFPAPQPQQKGMPINGPLIQQQPEEDPLSMFKQPDSPALDAYKKYIATMPDRSNYEYGKKGKILAAIAGVSDSFAGGNGYQTTRNLLDDPYKTAMEDYSNKGKGMAELANIEDKVNQNQNDVLKTRLDYMQKDKTQSDLSRYRDAQIADLEFKQRNAETPEQKQAFAIQIEELKQGGANKLEDKRQSGRVKLAGINLNYGMQRDANNAGLDRTTHATNRALDSEYNTAEHATNRDYDVNNPTTGIAPTQQASADDTALNRVLQTNPTYSKFLDRDPTNGAFKGYTIPSGSEEEYKQFSTSLEAEKKKILGSARAPGGLITPSNRPTSNTRVNVVAPDGTPGTIDIGELPAALSHGYKRK